MLASNGREYIAIEASGGGCACCAGLKNKKVCTMLRAVGCKGCIWREMTGEFVVKITDNEMKSRPTRSFSRRMKGVKSW